jgi:hypothetical protein
MPTLSNDSNLMILLQEYASANNGNFMTSIYKIVGEGNTPTQPSVLEGVGNTNKSSNDHTTNDSEILQQKHLSGKTT